MSFLMAGEALDLGDISLFSFDGVGIKTRCRGIVATTLSLSFIAPKILVVLVFPQVGGGCLLSGRWLFPTGCVSRGGVGGLIFSGVLLLLFCGPVPLGAPWVHFAGVGRGLKHCFCLCTDRFFNDLFSGVQILVLGIQLSPDGRSQAFSEVSDHNLLV